MPTWLLAIFFIGSFGGVCFLIARHFPSIASLRTDELAHIRHQQLKTELLLTRLDRLLFTPLRGFFRGIRPWTVWLGKQFHRLLKRLKALEHYYEKVHLQKQRPVTHAVTAQEQVSQLLAEAKEFSTKELFDDAERKYIAAIALDPKSLSAYEGLGDLYFKQKEYEAAKETYAHIVKLNERNAAAYARLGAIASASGNLADAEKDYAKAAALASDLVASHVDLGVVHQAMEKYDAALENFLQARELEPKNPRVLDLLLATAIILRKRTIAEEALMALAEANPENQKLAELEKRVAELPDEELIKPRKKKVVGP